MLIFSLISSTMKKTMQVQTLDHGPIPKQLSNEIKVAKWRKKYFGDRIEMLIVLLRFKRPFNVLRTETLIHLLTGKFCHSNPPLQNDTLISAVPARIWFLLLYEKFRHVLRYSHLKRFRHPSLESSENSKFQCARVNRLHGTL